MKPTIVIDKEAHQKIMYWVEKSTVEVSGLGMVQVEKDGVLRVIDAMMLPQKNGAAHTDIEPEAVNKAMYELRDTPGLLKFWWHSHVNMPVFWSSTDHTAMKDFGSAEWIIATVFNKKKEMRSAFYSPTGIQSPWGAAPLFYDELTTTIHDPVKTEKLALWDAEYLKNILPKSPVIAPSQNTWSMLKGMTGNGQAELRRPKGMSKRQWREFKNTPPANAYGLSQEDLTEMAQNGWSVTDIDTFTPHGFSAHDCAMLSMSGYTPDDIWAFLGYNYSASDIMADCNNMVDDDVPVADRGTYV